MTELENLVSLTQFCDHHNLDHSFINSLNEHDLIEVIIVKDNSFLHEETIPKLEKIIRLHFDLSINLEGIDVIIQLLERIENLEEELAIAKNTLNRFDLE